jgi:hypothetical protein
VCGGFFFLLVDGFLSPVIGAFSLVIDTNVLVNLSGYEVVGKQRRLFYNQIPFLFKMLAFDVSAYFLFADFFLTGILSRALLEVIT